MWQLVMFKLGIFLCGGFVLSYFFWGVFAAIRMAELRPVITQAQTFHEMNPALQRLVFDMKVFGAGNTRAGAQELTKVQRLAERVGLINMASHSIETKHERMEIQLAIVGMNLNSFSPWGKRLSLAIVGLSSLLICLGGIPLIFRLMN